jgi:hypothetical protein
MAYLTMSLLVSPMIPCFAIVDILISGKRKKMFQKKRDFMSIGNP